MEMKIYSPSEDGFLKEISWNHEEVKAEVTAAVEHYRNLAYTDDQIPEAKKDIANLRKFVSAIEDERKRIKKRCLEPYEEFERKCKEIVAIVNEAAYQIDTQIKSYENDQKEEKRRKIKELFASAGFQSFVKFEMVFDSKWLNKSVSLKSVQEQLTSRMYAIGNDVLTLSQLPEFSFEAMEVYKETLDMNKAIAEGKRLSEIQKRKEAAKKEEEARRKVESEIKAAEAASAGMIENTPTFEPEQNTPERAAAEDETKQWVSFKALLSIEDAKALKQLFLSRNIEFKAI